MCLVLCVKHSFCAYIVAAFKVFNVYKSLKAKTATYRLLDTQEVKNFSMFPFFPHMNARSSYKVPVQGWKDTMDMH